MSKDLSKHMAVQAIHDARFVVERHLVGYSHLCSNLKVSASVLEEVLEAASAPSITDTVNCIGPAQRAEEFQRLRAALANAGIKTPPQPDVPAFAFIGPRDCKQCGWTLPEKFTGYIGGCPRCMLKLCGDAQ